MKLIDRIALNRLINIITSFIIQVLKIIKTKDTDTNRWLPRWRKNK